jgi:dihydropteroate synthase type 2
MDALQQQHTRLSVDSFRPETQLYAMRKGVDFLNDIEGFARPELYPQIAEARCNLIVMHSVQRRGIATRVESEPATILDQISFFFEERLNALQMAGVKRERFIVDPGMGFFLGRNPEPSVKVLQSISQLKLRFDLPVLISVSRKSFLRNITGRAVPEIEAATLTAEIYASLQEVDYIRTHNVKSLFDATRVLAALTKSV